MTDDEFGHRPAARLLRYLAIAIDLVLLCILVIPDVFVPAYDIDFTVAALLVGLLMALLDISAGAAILEAIFGGIRSRLGGGGYGGSGYGSGYGGSFGPPATPVARPPAAAPRPSAPVAPAAAGDDDTPTV